MTAITIRRLPEGIKQKLRMRAAEHGRSMEAEAREILVHALEPTRPDIHWLDVFIEFGEKYGDESLPIPARTESPRYVDFSGWSGAGDDA